MLKEIPGKILMIALLFLLLFNLIFFLLYATKKSAYASREWNYKIILMRGDAKWLEKNLNGYGMDGWELVHFSNDVWIFKK